MSALLFEALRTALDAARATGGLVDPTIGRTLRLAGYDATFSVVRGRDGRLVRPSFVRDPNWRTVELDETTSNRVRAKGVELDLGATAKALAADRAADRAHAATDTGVLISLGGDIAVAGPPPKRGWSVRIAEDNASPLDFAGPVVGISVGGLATSGTTVRRWASGAHRLHHIVDPRTGRPASACWRSATSPRSRASMRTRRARPRSSSASVHRSGSMSCSCLRGSCVTTGGRSSSEAGRRRRRQGDRRRVESDDALVPDPRDRRCRSAAAHGSGRFRRAQLDPLAERTPAAVSRRRAPSKRDADSDRIRGHTRRHHGRRRICARRVARRGDPVRVPVPPHLAWAGRCRLRPVARARHHQLPAHAARLSHVARRALARVCVLAGRAPPFAGHGQRRTPWLDDVRRLRIVRPRCRCRAPSGRAERSWRPRRE